MNIGEAAAASGVSAKMIRYYEEVGLLGLWRDENRASADVKRLALAHAAQLEEKAHAIAEMGRALRHLAERCEGNHRPGCPIIKRPSCRLRGRCRGSSQRRAGVGLPGLCLMRLKTGIRPSAGLHHMPSRPAP